MHKDETEFEDEGYMIEIFFADLNNSKRATRWDKLDLANKKPLATIVILIW